MQMENRLPKFMSKMEENNLFVILNGRQDLSVCINRKVGG